MSQPAPPLSWRYTFDEPGPDFEARAGTEIVGRVRKHVRGFGVVSWAWTMHCSPPFSGFGRVPWVTDDYTETKRAAVEAVRHAWTLEWERRETIRQAMIADPTHASRYAVEILSRHVSDPDVLVGLERAKAACLEAYYLAHPRARSAAGPANPCDSRG